MRSWLFGFQIKIIFEEQKSTDFCDTINLKARLCPSEEVDSGLQKVTSDKYFKIIPLK